MKTHLQLNSLSAFALAPLVLWSACCSLVLSPGGVQAAPPTAADNIDYAASGFQFPPGVNPSAWATAAGATATGGINYAGRPTVSGPMMAPPMAQQMGPPAMGSPASMMAMGMPGMGPNGPVMGRPGMEGPMMGPAQMQMPGMSGASKIPASFPSGPIPGMGQVVPTGLQAPMGPAAYQAAMQAPYGQTPYGVAPVGYNQPGCDAMYSYPSAGYAGYGNACGCGDASCEEGGCGFQGLLPALTGRSNCNQCRGAGCQSCASRTLQNDCIGHGGVFGDMVNGKCMDNDLGLLLGSIGGGLAGLADCLKPYGEAGKCAQRWYDLSGEYMMLSQNFSQGDQIYTYQGIDGAGGVPVLSLSDAEENGLTSGMRLSASVIAGVGGNVEATYMGGHEWNNTATALGIEDGVTGDGDLYSYISEFGVTPADGYDDTDRSLIQSLKVSSKFHSGEINYRRRVVGPSCKFQGSWLVGLRYLRYDNNLGYDAIGSYNNRVGTTIGSTAGGELRFFESDVRTKNDLFGAQLGYDLWWNVTPGVHFGVGMKGAWVQNDWQRNVSLTANSAGPGAVPGTASSSDGDREGTVMGELEAALVYRFSHEWSFRSAYHLIAIDDIIGTTLSRDDLISGVDGDVGTVFNPTSPDQSAAVLQGFTVGLEYMW
ncbi:Putative beta barrel porin-7 (BBP7) [Neorhodopirellula lusitana]|uniref:Beta barrel porin-7 (BBP7) n=1 Tax=Neorhodopirellula lusitana TaxID=445327 RepID=A0ABY1QKI4_9BACT|nr:BBP7 family outer membrane beta-barrel protein [Neorhodopirellula lusitana]SMP74305.1 Putative beta barrel porin-7 (BBP7) [Neorhodopirellula lusitana]